MRVVFMGSPSFALPSLDSLSKELSVVAVVCQPDRPAGRGRRRVSPVTKQFASEAGISVLQPERVGDPDALSAIAETRPELIVVAAYGQILPQELLDLPDHGSLNVHASLLPRWRGAAPVQAAIRSGERETGVTIMKMDAGLDTGPIISQRAIPIEPDDTGGSLTERLARLGAELLIETVPKYVSGEAAPLPQEDAIASYAPMLKKSDGALDLSEPAEQLARQIRAYDPWPGSFMMWGDVRLGIRSAHAATNDGFPGGEVQIIDKRPAIGTGLGLLVLDIVQPAGKQEMTGAAFVRGAPDFVGAKLLP